MSDVSGLQAALDAKLASASFVWSGLGGKPSTFAPSAHSHVIADTTGLQAALDGKQAAGSYSLTSHVHDWSVITGKPSTFTPSAHSHVISDVTGLQAALDARFNLSTSNVTSGTIKSTNNANVDGANFWVDTTNKTTAEYGFVVTRSNALVGGIRLDGHGLFSTAQIGQGATGILYLGNQSTAAAYLYWNGGSYAMPSGPLLVNGSTVWTAATFDPATKATLGNHANFADVTANRYYLAENVTQSVLNPNMSQAAMFGSSTTTLGGIVTDRLAFTPPTTATWSTDGTNFTSITVPRGIFKGMISNQWGGFNIPVSVQKVRFTWSPLGYIFMDDFVAACSTNGSSIRFIFEKSADGTTWLPYFTSSWTSTWPGYITHKLNGTPSSEHQHFRITIERNQTSSNDVTIGALSIISSYGGSSPLYTWDADKNFTLQGSGQFYVGSNRVLHMGDVQEGPVADSIVRRNGGGYIRANWFDATSGMYSSSSGVHFDVGGQTWGASLYANHSSVQLALRTAGAVTRGFIYADTSNNIGLLTHEGNWKFLLPDSGSPRVRVNGTLQDIWTAANFTPDSKYNTTGGMLTGALQVHTQDTSSWTHHAELSRADSGDATGAVYLRFHHYNRWWRRIKADHNGFSLVGGGDETLQDLRTSAVYCGGNRVWDAGNFNPGSKLNLTDISIASEANRGVQRDSVRDINVANVRFDGVRKGLVGVYDPAQTQAIWSMGTSYMLADGGSSTNYGNHYGLAFSYNPDYGGAGNNPQSKADLNHQLLVQMYGVTMTAIGTGIWTSGRIECAGNGGWTMGSYANKNRIDYDGSKFRFINAANGNASVEMSGLTLNGDLTAASGSVYTSGGLIYSSNWWRSTGQTGWFNATYSSGIYSNQTQQVRTYNGSSFHSEGAISAAGVIVASQAGFQSATYASGRNRIWSFANADSYGLSYYQGAGGWSGQDTINFHFGNTAEASTMHKFRMDGVASHAGDLYVKGSRVPVFTSSTGAPSGGVDGDIHITY